jgi:hypothetical protein
VYFEGFNITRKCRRWKSAFAYLQRVWSACNKESSKGGMSMPRTVRNFWVEADIDGYKSNLSGGGQAKDSGMVVTVLHREDGVIADSNIKVVCTSDGMTNKIIVYAEGKAVYTKEVFR